MTHGIYTLANDVVFDQLVALLNSIEVNAGSDIPVCVIAYDEQVDRVREEIKSRKNVELLDNRTLFKRWEDFSTQVWKAHPNALQIWEQQGIVGVRRLAMNRRYCAFDPDSQFEKFIYFDADVLVLNSVDFIFEQLEKDVFVVYDFQYKDPTHIYNVKSPKLTEVFAKSRIESEIFCAGFYASQKGLFPEQQRELLISYLEGGEAEILYMSAPNQSVLNYMVMRSNIPVYNLGLKLPNNQKTGNAVTSSHFENRDNVLYDRGNQLTYLHYIGIKSTFFNRLCAGENIDFPYRDIFLHYRYLHEPNKRPKFTTKPKAYNAPPPLTTRVLRRLGLKK